MIPLQCPTIPQNNESLIDGLNGGLRRVFRLANGSAVNLRGKYPAYDELYIDLNDAEVDLSSPPANSIGVGRKEPGISLKRLSIVGRPIRRNGASVDLELTGDQVHLDFDRTADGRPVLALVEANGHLRLRLPQESLQALLLEGVREVAARQSVEVNRTDLNLKQLGARSLEATVRVAATKKAGFFPVKGVIVVTGRLDIDDSFIANVSQLSCSGEGIVGSLIAPLVRSKLDTANGQSFSLANLPFGKVAFHDLRVDVNCNELVLQAIFGHSN